MVGVHYWDKTYGSDEYQTWIVAVKDVLVKIRHSVIPRRNVWQEWKRPGKSGPEENIIYIGLGGTVFEVYSSVFGIDLRYWGPSLDLGMFEGIVSKEHVVATANDGMNG